MKIDDYKAVFVAVGLVGILLFASPALALVLHLPAGEGFSELYILGPGHMAEDLPFNVTEGVDYLVYVGVGNHVGSSAYYVLHVKFRNETEPLPNSTSNVASPLESLYEYRVFLGNEKSWEAPLTFSFSNVRSSENQSSIGGLIINGVDFNINEAVSWDVNGTGYYYQIFLELWIYDARAEPMIQFNDRFVTLWLNMTAPV